jgi:hypothetical protein
MPENPKKGVELPEWSKFKWEYLAEGLRIAWTWVKPVAPLLVLVIVLKLFLVRRERLSKKSRKRKA